MGKTVEQRERVVVRFAGDSGDGMQLVGGRFTDATALLGNDLATLPDFPAEIRAPAGTIPGVSAFQIHFASRDILTPGDTPNVLVAMNPAALKANLATLERGATIIANEDAFTKRNLEKAGYAANPLEDGTLADFRLHRVPMTTLTTRAAEGLEGVGTRDAGQSEEPVRARPAVVALRPPDRRHRALDRGEVRQQAGRRARRTSPPSAPAGASARRPSCSTCSTASRRRPTSRPAPTARSTARPRPRSGCSPPRVRSGLPLLLASYPITPASELLHELSRHEGAGVRTIQAEDEIAAAGHGARRRRSAATSA